MGNQLTGIAPSQIFPVEHYLTDVTDYEFDASLGSTRFFKVARAKYKEGLAVVKVFAIHDPSLPLMYYKDQLEKIKKNLSNSSNCLPFLRSTLSNKAALLFRQYVRNNLYDRISTRPFLNTIEKKWIAFQLLCAINQAHRVKVCHGDIKSENVMITGWNWVLLTDFASFKPTFLPADNPAEFSFFYDTSRRRTCYIAPERFVEGNMFQAESATSEGSENLLDIGVIKKGELTPQMDIFSVGCVIAELFTEGHAPFDLSQLLAYCSGTYTPEKVLEKIEDPSIKALVEHMLQKDPAKRCSAEEYLVQWKVTAFPEVFYNYLKVFMGDFASIPILPADEKIARLKRDMETIIATLCPVDEDGDQCKDTNNGLVIVLSLVTSCLRTLKFCINKLSGLEILLMIAHHIPDDLILDRIIPYMLHFITDPFPRVRAEAIRTLSKTLTLVNSVPRSDANIFPEYILPNLSNIAQDEIVLVRVAYAENIAVLAETALRFLEMVQLEQTTTQDAQADSVQDSKLQYQASYDDELQNLHEMIQQKVVTLLSDTENIVKQTLLENGITRLCVFFGRQKANDILLSHMITFLNDKNDWHLRGSFFDSIVGIAAYVGWQSSFILKPLIQQGLCDSEEFVICKALTALTSLIELGLLQKPIILDLASEIVPNLCHPNIWIRQGTTGVISVIANSFNIADVHCNLIPLLQPFIKQPIIQVDKEPILLNVLKDPVPRPVYDYILRSPLIESFFDNLQDRQLLRNLCRTGHKPSYSQPDDGGLAQLMRKLQSQGMTEVDEDKLLLLKDIMLKQQRAKSSPSDQQTLSPGPDDPDIPGIINIQSLEKRAPVQKYHADLLKPPELRSDASEKAPRKIKKKTSTLEPQMMNEEWKSMFGTNEPQKTSKAQQPGSPVHPAQEAMSTLNPGASKAPSGQPAAGPSGKPAPPLGQAHKGLSTLGPISMSQLQAAAEGTPEKKPQVQENRLPAVQTSYASCKQELSRLVAQKREQYAAAVTRKTLIEEMAIETKIPPASWKPKGLLVAHLHEHKAAVNRIQVSHDHMFFATCSNDGTVKVWDTTKLFGKSNTNCSRQTYGRQPGRIKALTFCQSSHSIASASDDGSIHVNRIETGAPRFGLTHSTNLDLQEEGCAVDITHFDTGSQSVVTYATVQGHLVGWDLRAPGIAWRLRNEPRHGLITSFVVDPHQCWMAVGTSNGAHTCWDLRFQLPITTIHHSTASQVRRLILHPNHPSWIISAVQGNNEVSMWDMETGARQFTLWASPSPALSQTQTSNHAVHGLYCIPSNEHSPSFLTAGSDQRLRYWSLTNPDDSGIIAGSVNDPQTRPAVTYKRRLIDGTEVIVETYDKHRSTHVVGETGRHNSEQVPVGHRNIINDLGVILVSPNSAAVATASHDGVIKIWK
ncbi:phosphoinositide 3-kinase regulatory subunit 4-like [Asterias rubens]|uniref:phosphoinositide 3-kinase regulatory subunit 4-like n=1 Tax=Asterias rubens TaxID=7604 RepID=UPI0014558ED0|nr:phosphoinositide 3-kinase regulatory subunit 4-like [Asterias rubens]